MQHDEPDYKRILTAIFLAAIVLTGWQGMVEWPRRQKLAHYAEEQAKVRSEQQEKQQQASPVKADEGAENPQMTLAQRLAQSPRIAIDSPALRGSLDLKGARFDDLDLTQYKETLEHDSPDVRLLAPNGDKEAYFAQAGWVSPDGKTKVPDQNTLWQADGKTLSPGHTVHLTWDNGAGVTFVLAVSLDKNYMFTIDQRVDNHSASAVSVVPYGYINRAYQEEQAKGRTSVLHEGPLGVMDNALEQVSYKDLREKGNKSWDDASGWLGITDRYWLAALIPGESHYKTTFSHYTKDGEDRYQVDYIGHAQQVAGGASAGDSVRLFAGAKELSILDAYAAGDPAHGVAPIPLFDRSIDFGLFYFLTKPMLKALTYFFALLGNMGLAIMLLTVIVRGALFPLANKSFKATAQMRALQPEINKIRERYVDDSIALNKEMLELYKRNKVNPASGCLPVLIQMPVFFALYKVLYVSIEMRHAPFFGWIKDLSVMDPSNVFTLFGTVNWPVPEFLHLGLLPILMCITMIVQMKQQPKPADPAQARMMSFMPYFFLFIFSKMPAGLVVYWTWSNTISIVQQRLIGRRHGEVSHRRHKAPASAPLDSPRR